MILGLVNEFFYTNIFNEPMIQKLAFRVFSFSSMGVGVLLGLLGVYYWQENILPRFAGIVFFIYLPLAAFLFNTGQSAFLAPILLAIVFSMLTLSQPSKNLISMSN